MAWWRAHIGEAGGRETTLEPQCAAAWAYALYRKFTYGEGMKKTRVDAVTQYGNPLNSVRLYWAVWTYNKVQVSRGGFGTAYRMGVFNIL